MLLRRKVRSNKGKNGCPYKSRTAKTKRKVSSNKGIKGDESKTSKTRTRKRFRGGSNLPLENKCTPTESHSPNKKTENKIVCEQDVKQISASACVEGICNSLKKNAAGKPIFFTAPCCSWTNN